ncbi:MAG: hypothetical protein ACOCX2_09345, partial [Armatimonadota bacterium]
MIRRMALILSLSLITAAVMADGGLIPLTDDRGLEQEGASLLRGDHTLTLYQRPDSEPLRLTVEARQVGSYQDAVVARWPADGDAPRASVSVEPGETGELVLEGCEPGPVQVRITGGETGDRGSVKF